MDLYICDFMKNKECGHGCAYFGGTCAATSDADCAMDDEDVKRLNAADFEKMHYAFPDELRREMLQKGWHWRKHLESANDI